MGEGRESDEWQEKGSDHLKFGRPARLEHQEAGLDVRQLERQIPIDDVGHLHRLVVTAKRGDEVGLKLSKPFLEFSDEVTISKSLENRREM